MLKSWNTAKAAAGNRECWADNVSALCAYYTGAVSHDDDDDTEPALCNGRIHFDVTVYILGHY